MEYKTISIKEAVEKINNTWFLPAIQRPYDWGERSRKQDFIYKLFDSLFRGYPIGSFILWDTQRKIPCRSFLTDYDSEKLERVMDKGRWGNRGLIYDGQQRLQSLFSCLLYTFHNKVLYFNLLFDRNKSREAQGFKFFERNAVDIEPAYISLPEIFSLNDEEIDSYKTQVLDRLGKLSQQERDLVIDNISQLHDVFTSKKRKILAYYPLNKDISEDEALDIFYRVNTTGMSLTNAEMVSAKIKKLHFDFDTDVWNICKEIRERTGGLSSNPDYILKILFLLVKGGVRVDPKRLDEKDIKNMLSKWAKLSDSLLDFYNEFIYKEFKINNPDIIRLNDIVIPLIVYTYHNMLKERRLKDFNATEIRDMKKYFIISQLKKWDLQSYVDNFCEIIKDKVADGVKFPLKEIRAFVKDGSKRGFNLYEGDFNDDEFRTFVLKVSVPGKAYLYSSDSDIKFDPQLDHIFPQHPKEGYRKRAEKLIDTVWNLQPINGEINMHDKSNLLPCDFFTTYPKVIKDYDHLPSSDPKSYLWLQANAAKCISRRKSKMLNFIRKTYDLNIIP